MATTDSEKDEEMKARDAEDEAAEASEAEESAEHEAEGSDDEGSDDEGSDDEGSDDEGSDDEGSDDEGSDDDGSDDEGSDDEGSDDEGSDDEGSDDEGSDDEGSDDEGSDDEGSDDEGSRASDSSAKRSGKGRRRKKDGMTAGARLAAAKAAKAARKAAKRGKEKKEQDPVAQVRESALAHQVEQAGSWAKQNRTMVLAAVAVIALAFAGWLGFRYHTEEQAQAAATLLEDAVEIADAPIVAEEEGEDASSESTDDEDAPPTFATEQARAEAALAAYQQVLSQYPDSAAAPWARLGEAKALFQLGRYDEARASYDRAIQEGGDDDAIVSQALESKGFTYEAEEKWDEALGVYQELARVDDGRFDSVAKYDMARMYMIKGERDRATETLREVVDHLQQAEDNEDEQDFQYVLAQAQLRLRELDPSAVTAPPPSLGGGMGGAPGGGIGGAPGGAGPGGNLTPEQIQELIRRFQQQGAGGAGGGAGGAGGGAE